MSALFGNFKKTLGRQVWSGLLQLLTVVLIARAYGPVGSGFYAIALLLPTMLALLLGLGLAPANIYYIASKRFSVRSVAGTMLKLWCVLSLCGLAIGFAVIAYRGDAWFPGLPAVALWLALLAFPPQLFIALSGSVFQGIQDYTTYNFGLSLQPLLVFLGVVACYAIGLEPTYLVAAFLGGTAITAALMAAALWRLLAGIERRHDAAYPVTVALSYGLRSHLANIMAFINYRIDLFLVNFFIDPIAAGIYGVAVQVAEKLWLVSQAVSTVLLPRLSELGSERVKAVEVTCIVSRAAFAFTTIVALVAAGGAWYVFRFVFGEQFTGAFVPFLLMLPGIVAGSSIRILAGEISARGRPEINFYMAVVVVVISVVCNVQLIPAFGLAGAAISTSIAYTVSLVLRLVMFQRYTGRSFKDAILLRPGDAGRVLSKVWHGSRADRDRSS